MFKLQVSSCKPQIVTGGLRPVTCPTSSRDVARYICPCASFCVSDNQVQVCPTASWVRAYQYPFCLHHHRADDRVGSSPHRAPPDANPCDVCDLLYQFLSI